MARNFNPIAILPVLVAVTALILSFLCVFAGSSPGFMQPYSIFHLNTTRLGQNAIEKIDDKIMGFNITRILTKRSLPEPARVEAMHPMITHPPTLNERDIDDLFDAASSRAAEFQSDAGEVIDSVQGAVSSKVTEVAGAVESGVNSLEGLVVSKISSAVASAQTAVVREVNETYADFVNELELKGFYSIYLRSTCEGEYVTPTGQNITVGESALPPNGTKMEADSCSKHSALNPLGLILVLFYIGIFFAGVSVLLGIWGMICFSRKLAILNAVGALPALGFLGLGTVGTHGFAVAVTKLLNLLTGKLGLRTDYGGRWIAMAWAMTILVLINIAIWTVLAIFGDHMKVSRTKKSSNGLPEHEMKSVHGNHDSPSGSDRYDNRF